jgi:hypothetical protein
MFDQILQLVKESLGNHPELAGNIPQDQQDAIHHEIATHIHNGLQNQPEAPATAGGLLSQFENKLGSGDILTSAVTGGLVGSLASKFGLSPLITGAIAASLPGLMEKYVQKHNAATAPGSPVTT